MGSKLTQIQIVMKPTAQFSWFKLGSFIGAGLAAFFAYVNGGSAGILIKSGEGFNGVGSILSALGWVAVAVLIYLNYQRKSSNSSKS